MTTRLVNVILPIEMEGTSELTIIAEPVLEWELTIREVMLIREAGPVLGRIPTGVCLFKGAVRPGLIASVEPVTAFSVGTIIQDHIESLEQ